MTLPKEVMDLRTTAEYLAIVPDTLYRYAAEGVVPAFRMGNRWKFKKSIIDKWIEEQSYRSGKAKQEKP